MWESCEDGSRQSAMGGGNRRSKRSAHVLWHDLRPSVILWTRHWCTNKHTCGQKTDTPLPTFTAMSYKQTNKHTHITSHLHHSIPHKQTNKHTHTSPLIFTILHKQTYTHHLPPSLPSLKHRHAHTCRSVLCWWHWWVARRVSSRNMPPHMHTTTLLSRPCRQWHHWMKACYECQNFCYSHRTDTGSSALQGHVHVEKAKS